VNPARPFILLAVGLGILAVAFAPSATWALLVGLALLAAGMLAWWKIDRPYELRQERLAQGQCPGCGYDLTGNVSGVCPECGVEA
jgi:hypothetical protein